MRGCIQPKSSERIAVEALLSQSTVENPVTVEQIARIAGCDPGIVRTHIHNAINRGEAHNLRAGNNRPGLYVAGLPVKQSLPNMPAPRTAPPSGPYEPKPWTPPRAGCMDAFDLGSLHCGEVIPRQRPAIIAGRAMEPGVMRGGVS
jgi:hypothetical protein